MPRPSTPEPPVMTWRKASLYLGIAIFFDVLKFLCEVFFWVLGPALLAYYVSNHILWGGAVSNAAGAAVGLAAGFWGYPAFVFFGIILGVLFGFMGWFLIGLLLIFTNRRIFTVHVSNALWFIGGLAIGEVPLVGTVPSITGATWFMFHRQIKSDKEAHAKWKKDNAVALAQEARERQQVQSQAHSAFLARAQQQAAAEEMALEAVGTEAASQNDLFDELATQAANDNNPERVGGTMAA